MTPQDFTIKFFNASENLPAGFKVKDSGGQTLFSSYNHRSLSAAVLKEGTTEGYVVSFDSDHEYTQSDIEQTLLGAVECLK